MFASRGAVLAINVVGGVAVLGSYVLFLQLNPGEGAALWGGVPEAARPLYGVSMIAAAVGYLAALFYVLRRLDPTTVRLPGGLGYGAFAIVYLAALAPSAAWMPLTFAWLDAPSAGLWWAVKGVLAVVALAAIALTAAIATARPAPRGAARAAALVGAGVFAAHTTVLDAVLWTMWFPAG